MSPNEAQGTETRQKNTLDTMQDTTDYNQPSTNVKIVLVGIVVVRYGQKIISG